MVKWSWVWTPALDECKQCHLKTLEIKVAKCGKLKKKILKGSKSFVIVTVLVQDTLSMKNKKIPNKV